MRLAILSDIHGNLPALEAVIGDLKQHKPDVIINLGDCVSGPLWPKETCDLLRSLDWPTVRGNCDRIVGQGAESEWWESDRFAATRLTDGDRQWLANLPQTIDIAPGILACHGTPESDSIYLTESDVGGQLAPLPAGDIAQRLGAISAALVLCGHSHIPRLMQVRDGQLVLNPGSVGLPAYDHVSPNGNRKVSESGSPLARYALVTGSGTMQTAQHIAVSYNYQHAAQKAEQEIRPDYARALLTGTMG